MENTGWDSVIFTFTSSREVFARVLASVLTRWPTALVDDLDNQHSEAVPVANLPNERLPVGAGHLMFYRDAAMARHMDEAAYSLMPDGDGPFAVLVRERRDVVFKVSGLDELRAADHDPDGIRPPDPYEAWFCTPVVVEVTAVTPGDPESQPFSSWILGEVRRACSGTTRTIGRTTLEFRDANRYGPLSEERLQQLESRFKGRLPDDYRAFLLRHNGGRPTLSRFTFEVEGEEQESVLEWFFAVHDQPYEEPDDWDPEGGGLPPYFGQPLESAWDDLLAEKPKAGVLPIGRDPGGNLIGIGYAGKRKGAVWWYDHETESFVRLGDNFTAFIAGLTKLPPEDCMPWLLVE